MMALQDLRYAIRGLWREPGFAAAVILTFGLALGANATMFGITDRLLLRAPAHVEDPDRVVRIGVEQRSPATGLVMTATAMSYHDFVDLRRDVRGFAEIGVVGGTNDASLGTGPDAELVPAAPASASFFRVLGVRPALGRFFTEDEDHPPHGSHVAVISHSTWQGRFGGSAAVLGQTLELNGTAYAIVGVAPKGFNGIGLQPTAVWLPVTAFNTLSWDNWHVRGSGPQVSWLTAVARLAPDVTPPAAAAEATALLAGIYPANFEADPGRRVVLGHIVAARSEGFSPASVQLAARVSVWLMAVAGVVLLIACANVANLLLGRSLRRRQELAVRLALGVRRARLARQLFTETLLLAMLGGLLGLILAHWGGQVIRAVLLPGFEWQDSPFSARLLLFTLGALVLASLAAAAAPLVLASRTGGASALRSGGHATGRGSGARSALVVAQGALCVVLLIGAGLFVQSLRNVSAIDPGLAARQLVYVTLPGASHALYEEAAERAIALPQVEGAVLAAGTLPFRMFMSLGGFQAQGVDSVPTPPSGGPYLARVGPGYFGVAGTSILRGRGITEADTDGAQPVVVISRGLSEWIWPGEDALGRCIEVRSSGCLTIVGVAEDTRTAAIDGDPVSVYYRPLAQTEGNSGLALLVRMTDGGMAGLPALRREMQALDPAMAAVQLQPLEELLAPQLRPWRLGAILFTVFGAIALALATLGLYAVLAYDVAQRRREMGVRMALGATSPHIMRVVLSGAGRLIVVGIALGLTAAALLAPRVEPLLLGVAPRSPLIYLAVAALLIPIGLAAALLPALRALRVEITEALRIE
jgi:predicted permease